VISAIRIDTGEHVDWLKTLGKTLVAKIESSTGTQLA